MTRSRIILLVALLAAVAAVFAFDLQRFASLDYIAERQEVLDTYYRENMVQMLAIFGLIYVAFAALSLPAATVLTLLSGALFGSVVGVVMVSFASCIGATLAFTMVRFVGRDVVQRRYGEQLKGINEGFAREGAFYLFAVRLVPVFPFFLVNIVMALMPIRTWTFYWVSQLGMLPATIVYVYAGSQLAQISDATTEGLVPWELFLAFALLGIFPLIAKRGLGWMRARRAA